jgi:F0F1-type ATP synthase membrane subunit b/b'
LGLGAEAHEREEAEREAGVEREEAEREAEREAGVEREEAEREAGVEKQGYDLQKNTI